ncbi:hypothetical protein niasHT_022893 [Heterodera trifolii]|uniref:Uncharacterized protein n=1 Tax=Heterodera trifolii TaxID=157864 RepID=A0ABD2KI45_9BILA
MAATPAGLFSSPHHHHRIVYTNRSRRRWANALDPFIAAGVVPPSLRRTGTAKAVGGTLAPRGGTFRHKPLPGPQIALDQPPPCHYYVFRRAYIRLRTRLSSVQFFVRTPDFQEEKAMLQAPTAPIDASKFVAYVQERRKKRILFKGEFLMIQRSVDPQRCTTEVGVRMGERNQYPDTLPYDHNRVVLELRPGVDDSHYINASYVNSWIREKAYVVTQSVRSKQASNEMWRTVWELGSNTMVMLTKIFDFMRVMCLQYWPQTHFQFGEIHVETLETRTYAHFVIRTFRLRKTGGPGGLNGPAANANGDGTADSAEEERIVKHFHFTEWELNSFPYISAFVELRRRVRQWMEKSPVDAPIVVHCSNGGGRSGAFLALDANLELLQRTGQLDVYEYGRTLANSRQHLIDTVDQYIFIYDVLCEAVLCNIQPIGMHQLKNRSGMYKARKDRELMEVQDSHENKLLLMLTAPLRIGDCAGGHRLENRGKNRDVMVVPPDHSRPYLQTLHGESKDYTYINAVEVDGFTRKSEFIVTEWPKVPTLDSFWTLIFDHNVHTVISLTNQPSDVKQFPQFVHNKGKRNYGPFTVEVVNYQQYPGLQSHMVKISKRPTDPVPINSQPNPDKGANKKLRGTDEIRQLLSVKRNVPNRRDLAEQMNKLTFMISEIMASGASQQQLEAEVRLCCIIQVKMWPIENKVPLSTTALIEVLKMTRSWRKRAPDRPEQRPTIVMSHNGVSRCGIFIAANVCIDQMEMDHEVDVFHAVKLIRLNRPQLIDMKDEYKYLYDLMLHWYMTSPELRQFEPLEMSNSEPDDDDRSEDGASLGAATARGTRSRSGSAARRRRGSSRHDGHSLARSKSTRASSRHANATGANSAIQRVPTGGGRDNANSLAVSGGAQMLARNASSMSAGTAAGGGSRKRETIYLN